MPTNFGERTFNADAAIAINLIVKLVSPGSASFEPGEGYVELCGAAGTSNVPVGVSHSAAAAADDPIRVVWLGEALVTCGGTVAPGDPIESDSAGKAVKATGNSSFLIGYALEDGTTGKVIKMIVNPSFVNVPA